MNKNVIADGTVVNKSKIKLKRGTMEFVTHILGSSCCSLVGVDILDLRNEFKPLQNENMKKCLATFS